MNTLKEKQMQEALERMAMLNLHPNVITEFTAERKLNKSFEVGILYWLDDSEIAIVKDFEQKHDTLVYHVIESSTPFGKMLTLFHVSKHEDEWEYDRADLSNGIQNCYVKNLDDDWCSEFGYIHFRRCFGGVMRTA